MFASVIQNTLVGEDLVGVISSGGYNLKRSVKQIYIVMGKVSTRLINTIYSPMGLFGLGD